MNSLTEVRFEFEDFKVVNHYRLDEMRFHEIMRKITSKKGLGSSLGVNGVYISGPCKRSTGSNHRLNIGLIFNGQHLDRTYLELYLGVLDISAANQCEGCYTPKINLVDFLRDFIP